MDIHIEGEMDGIETAARDPDGACRSRWSI